ncbi:shikimate dehydrogenase family protein [Floccifex porci]|uniref:Shikimate dehydrogenase n=1 Tax=Floccifex porci TaxID=2606629 RepID=A0A7X2N1D5_9FIRM|nr:shikimate dehydrogenase [Floccifex porci]MSS00642.1 shikimate dehydrogenase [Floccifex porci]
MEYGLIGEHLGHSYSKLIQEKLLDNYTYEIQEVSKEDLDSFMKKREFKAINVTIPYKQAVIPYLEEMDQAARKIGAVNTIVNRNGKLYGYNTDYYGFRYMVETHGISLKGKKILVLGNGGASQAIQAVVHDLGACEMIITDLLLKDNVISIEEAYKNHTDVNIIINTTPMGMYPKVHGIAVDLSKFKKCEAVFDCIYNPQDTEFTLQAKERGIKVAVTGLEMLVGQAKRALEFFKNIEIEDKQIDRIYREILFETSNVVLVDVNMDTALQVARELKKECIVLDSENYEEQAISSNKVLLSSSQDKKTLSRNGFIIQSKNADEIICEFKLKVNQFNK